MPLDRERALRVRLVVFDVDGVLTDGGVYLGRPQVGEPLELKRFDIQDGLGLKMLVWSGLEVAIVSGRVSTATSARAEELGIPVFQDPDGAKIGALEALLDRHGIGWSEVAMLGDDLPDLPVLRRVGLPAAVANAVPEVLEVASWTGRRTGGHGAAREFSEALLKARGQWDEAVDRYCAERSGS